MPITRKIRLIVLSLAAVLVLAACGGETTAADEPSNDDTVVESAQEGEPDQPDEEPEEAPAAEGIPAADLRVTLNTLLAEHAFYAGAAVNEALQGNDEAFAAAAETLDANSRDLAGAVGLVYGDEAGDAFLGLWRSHIDMFVDYTQGVAAGDDAQAEAAVEDLTGYANDFAVFLNQANPDLPQDTVSELVIGHVLTTKDAVDSLAAGDAEAGFTDLREAMGHMHMIADPLAGAIAEQFPDRFPGDPDTEAVTLRRDLNLLLQEHTYLAGAAVNEALKGNDEAFGAAAGALDGNSQDLAGAIGSIYGEDAGDAFLGLWRSHIDMFVDYTQGVAAGDEEQQEQAVSDLTGYATDFSVFVSDATGIDQEAAEALVVEHVLTLKDAVDAIAAGDGNPFAALREAGEHMHMIADPLAAQIADQQGLS